eukprot:TRINITY_DN20046_c0_g1_i1.p1 TRINITY_DN20046_c0_g1~~TRINITY_DN20046_c0_g1_i1.p1  ORF type:complete len:680 (-),score=127.18 TRINITY_DN20046_c0_g1_i1:143-2182(-)
MLEDVGKLEIPCDPARATRTLRRLSCIDAQEESGVSIGSKATDLTLGSGTGLREDSVGRAMCCDTAGASADEAVDGKLEQAEQKISMATSGFDCVREGSQMMVTMTTMSAAHAEIFGEGKNKLATLNAAKMESEHVSSPASSANNASRARAQKEVARATISAGHARVVGNGRKTLATEAAADMVNQVSSPAPDVDDSHRAAAQKMVALDTLSADHAKIAGEGRKALTKATTAEMEFTDKEECPQNNPFFEACVCHVAEPEAPRRWCSAGVQWDRQKKVWLSTRIAGDKTMRAAFPIALYRQRDQSDEQADVSALRAAAEFRNGIMADEDEEIAMDAYKNIFPRFCGDADPEVPEDIGDKLSGQRSEDGRDSELSSKKQREPVRETPPAKPSGVAPASRRGKRRREAAPGSPNAKRQRAAATASAQQTTPPAMLGGAEVPLTPVYTFEETGANRFVSEEQKGPVVKRERNSEAANIAAPEKAVTAETGDLAEDFPTGAQIHEQMAMGLRWQAELKRWIAFHYEDGQRLFACFKASDHCLPGEGDEQGKHGKGAKAEAFRAAVAYMHDKLRDTNLENGEASSLTLATGWEEAQAKILIAYRLPTAQGIDMDSKKTEVREWLKRFSLVQVDYLHIEIVQEETSLTVSINGACSALSQIAQLPLDCLTLGGIQPNKTSGVIHS